MGKFEKNNPYARHGNGQLHAGKSGGEARGTERLVPGGRTRETIAAKEERAAALIDNLERLAFNAKTENTQVLASQAALDRLLGKPVQTQVQTQTPRSTLSAWPLTRSCFLR